VAFATLLYDKCQVSLIKKHQGQHMHIFIFIIALFGISVSAIAHDDPEKIAAQQQEERLQQAQQQAQDAFELQRSIAQTYLASTQGWTVQLSISPNTQENGWHTVSLNILAPHHSREVSQASLISMLSAKKVIMEAQGNGFHSNLHLPQQQSATLMVKIKTKQQQTLFFKFEH